MADSTQHDADTDTDTDSETDTEPDDDSTITPADQPGRSRDASEKPLIEGSVREVNAERPIAQFARHPSATAIMQTLVDSAEPVGVTTLCERADISRPTWYEVRDLLLEFGMIEEDRTIEDRPRYSARRDSDVVEAWQRFRAAISRAAHDRSEN